MTKHNWYSLTIDEVFNLLKTSTEGLSETESKDRRLKYGSNVLPEREKLSAVRVLGRQFLSPLIYLLLAAAAVSFVLAELIDVYVILAAVIINVMVGFFQEYKAEKALAKLKEVITLSAKIVRHGVEKVIDASELVPGDILILKSGDKVPADCRLIKVTDFLTDEAPLTGESLPVNKFVKVIKGKVVVADQQNMAFMGTLAVAGEARAAVVATGIETQIGQIAGLLKQLKKEKTPLQEKLLRLSNSLVLAIVIIVAALFVLGIILGRDVKEMFLLSVAVAVAAIPEGMLVGVTAVMAIGMQRMLKRKALIRRLNAAETLGSTTVICTDKTGTLTEGKMAVASVVTASEKYDLETEWADGVGKREVKLALEIGALCNDAIIENVSQPLAKWTIYGSPTNVALILGAVKFGLNKKQLDEDCKRIDILPFSSERKYLATLHEYDRKRRLLVSGAFERILNICDKIWIGDEAKELKPARKDQLLKTAESLAASGLRLVAVGFNDFSHDGSSQITEINDLKEGRLTFVGFIALRDPIRAGVRETIKLARRAGIRTVMITGDHKATAAAIGHELGFETRAENIVEGKDLAEMTEDELIKRIKKISIFARISPQDKIRIVDAWQSQGEVVAVTGDGINDAPALKTADIGVALGSGTDVTKESADIVLLDNNFKNIVAAVEEGRAITDNIKKIVLYLLSDSFSEVVLISLSLIFLGFLTDFPLPLTAVQILWINIVTDGLPNIALTLEPEEKEIMLERPQKRDAPVLDMERRFLVVLISAITGLGNFLIFLAVWRLSDDISLARTVTFASLGIDSLLYVFSCRTLRKPIWQKNIFSNKYLLLAVLVGLIFQISAIYIPGLQNILMTRALNLFEWGLIIAMSAVVILAIEVTKIYFLRLGRRYAILASAAS